MSDTSVKLVWGVFGDSTRGSSHLRSGLPNQDSLGKWAGSGGSPAVLAVSDGHGSASHFRSDIGSRMGVEAAVRALRETPVPVPDGHSGVLAQTIVQAWREAVMAHLAANPFTDREWAKLPPKDSAQAKSAVLANPPIAYGATLLAVLAAESEILYLQLGDGDILCVDQSGGTTRPLPADSRLIANQTTSLCQSSAVEDFRAAHFRAAEGPPPALILVSSDGYSNSFQSDEDFLRVGPDYLKLLRQYGPEKVEAQLQKILPEASRKGSGDDITLGFIQRMDTAAKPAPNPLPQTAAPAVDAAPQPTPSAVKAESELTPALEAAPPPAPAAMESAPQPTPGAEAAPESPPAAGETTPWDGALSAATVATPGRRFGPRPATDTGAERATPQPGPPAGGAPQPGRKLFWLKLALAGVCVLALTGAGLAWRYPLWVSSLRQRIRPKPPKPPKPPHGPPRYIEERHPNQEAPRTRERSGLRFRLRNRTVAPAVLPPVGRAESALRANAHIRLCLCSVGFPEYV